MSSRIDLLVEAFSWLFAISMVAATISAIFGWRSQPLALAIFRRSVSAGGSGDDSCDRRKNAQPGDNPDQQID
jgi:hypothetical protein